METYNSRLVFLDSTNNSTGTGIAASFPVNDTDNFTAQGNNKTMRVGLNSFSMYRNFYNINPTNCFFWIGFSNVSQADQTIATSYQRGQIPIGDYSHFTYDYDCHCSNNTYLDEAIAEAVAKALNDYFAVATYTAGKKSQGTAPGTAGNVECLYNSNIGASPPIASGARTFTIYFDNTVFSRLFPSGSGEFVQNIYFSTFKPSNLSSFDKKWTGSTNFGINQITTNSLFQDTYQIMGGQANYTGSLTGEDPAVPGGFAFAAGGLKAGYDQVYPGVPGSAIAPVPRMPIGNTPAQVVLTGFSVAQLSTLDELVIRTNMPSQNYQSPGIDQTIPTNLGLSPTNILARIPIDDTTFDEKRGIIHFIDHNNNFYLMLGSNTLTNIKLILTDGRGRELWTLGEDAQQSANMNFRTSLKIDYIILPDDREKLLLNADRMKLYPMNIGRR
jgi:hypothetical protein